MAKVISPLMSVEARGRVGGLVANSWRGISYIKAQSSPAQPRTQRQLNIRAITTMLVRMWQSLTPANRTNWDTYATLHPDIDWTGNPKRLTGLNWYVRCNLRLFRTMGITIDDPPTTPAPDAAETFRAANGILQSIITWTAPLSGALLIEIWAFGPASAGIAAKIQRAKLHTTDASTPGTLTITGLRPGTYTFWGRICKVVDGLASTYVSDTAVITAV